MPSEASLEGIEYLPLYLMDRRLEDSIPVGRDFQNPGKERFDTKKFYRENPFRETVGYRWDASLIKKKPPNHRPPS